LSQATGPVEDGHGAVGIFVNAHHGSDIVVAVALLGDLQGVPAPTDAVVAADLSVVANAEDVVERPAGIGDEGGSGLGRGDGEAGIVVGDEALLEVAIGDGDGGDAGQAQFGGQAALQGSEGALDAALGVWK
jgi:hypothetical protein